MNQLNPRVSCGHPGCLHHVTHPCERCGRTAGLTISKKEIKMKKVTMKVTKSAVWKLSILGFLLTVIGCIHTDPWTKEDKILEGTYLTFHCADWMQTRHADWTEFHETNPILGRAPSKTKTDLYFLGTGILHPIITHLLPQEYRKWWQIITIGVESTTVFNNFHVGMRIGF
jgi:hypothetical protein